MGYNSKDECIYEFHRDVPKTKEKKKRKSNHSHEYFRYGHRNKEQNEVIRRLLKKHIKYLYVIRYYNTYGKYFKHGKMIYQSRVYCFGIMTDTNEFQYYLVPYKTTTINYSSWIKLYKSVLKDYIIDKDTEVLMDKDISTTDVVGTFFTIMHYTCLFRISRINAGDMYKRINHFYKFISKKKTFGEKSKSLVWDKGNKIMGQYYMSQFEYILFFRKGKGVKINNCGTSDILSVPNKKTEDERGKNLHDTEKPVELMRILIEK